MILEDVLDRAVRASGPDECEARLELYRQFFTEDEWPSVKAAVTKAMEPIPEPSAREDTITGLIRGEQAGRIADEWARAYDGPRPPFGSVD